MVEGGVKNIASFYATSLPADDSLRFLFRLDAYLYGLQGIEAIRYGNGLHTKHRHTRYHDFFVDRVKEGERVLDLGCGNGALSRDMAERSNAVVTGIDANPRSIEIARQMHAHQNTTYIVGDVLENVPEGYFDSIVLSNVLEHLPDRPEFLKKLTDLINPSRILIRVPLFDREWRVPLKKELGVEWRLDPTHETEYTLEQFEREIAAAGLYINHKEIRWGEIWAEVSVRKPDIK